MFQKFDYNGGRTFVVGDIHGEFGLLLDKLDEVGFDKTTDHLFSVGDLVDRGPCSESALYYLAQPWFHAIRGNHEQMVIDAGGTYWHLVNGGQWFNDLADDDERCQFIRAFSELPYLLQFTSPSGREIGLAHAAFPHHRQQDNAFITDWNYRDEVLLKVDYNGNSDVLWDRYQIGRALKHLPRLHKVGPNATREFNIANIDHVYFGHTPIKEPQTVGNCTWLDTGAFATKNLTVLEVL